MPGGPTATSRAGSQRADNALHYAVALFDSGLELAIDDSLFSLFIMIFSKHFHNKAGAECFLYKTKKYKQNG